VKTILLDNRKFYGLLAAWCLASLALIWWGRWLSR
jgi:hypothetical protein